MKTIKIPNQNGKLSNSYFSHISLPPAQKKLESEFPIDVVVQDPGNELIKSFAQLITLARCRLRDLSSVDTLLASGLDRQAFIQSFLEENKTVTYESEVVIYIYRNV